jgi:hypothetical protein
VENESQQITHSRDVVLDCIVFEGHESECKVWQREQKCQAKCPYLKRSVIAWLPHYPSTRRKSGRIYHRMVTGLQIARNSGAYMRFMTLTSAPKQKRHIRKSFDVLKLRIKRATVEKDGFVGFKFNRYFCLRTKEGYGVLHVIFWGRFIPQTWLSKNWLEIHGAHRADIRACFTKKRKVSGLVGYLLDRYLVNQPVERMSYGWKWAWLGFCKSWKKVKDVYGEMRAGRRPLPSDRPFFWYNYHNHSVDAWQCILWNPPNSSRQTKLIHFF